jgi:aspartyl-tRNA(Asn)/glutamyl-tRNA(Gln) amidotransferase subunit A
MNRTEVTADQLSHQYREGSTTVSDVISSVFEEIDRTDPNLKCFINTRRDQAMAEALLADEAIREKKPLGPLTGIPLAVKDNMHIRGEPTSCGSRILEGYIPPYSSTAVDRLRQAGAIVVGKTNLDEFAMGSSTENSAFFPTRNPHDPSRVPGGSSGGSAAAVAAGFVPVSLGSDTGGSIRQPASFCGVVGLKPTYGRVSRYGLVAFGSSLDQIGPFARSVTDVARILETMAGFDPLDSTSADVPTSSWVDELDQPVRGLKVGVPTEYFVDGMDAGVTEKVRSGIARLEEMGCEIEELSLPHTEYAIASYYLICTAEASSNLARYDGVRYGLRVADDTLQGMYRQTRMAGFGSEVKRRILLGTYALSAGYYDAYYLKAQKVRTLILEDFQKAFEKVDVLVTPTTPTTAFEIGKNTDDPLAMYLNDIFTTTCNLAGLPGLSIPCGSTSDNLPVGMQLIGNHFEESNILRVAHHFEQAGGFDA